MLHENYFADRTMDWFFGNRLGFITESSNGNGEIFIGVSNTYSGYGILGSIVHLSVSPLGNVEKTDAYPETFGHLFLDYYSKNGLIYLLSKERNGVNLTHDMVLHVYNKNGDQLYSKYIRNTEYLIDFAAITEVNGFHATIVAYANKGSSLVKLSF